MVIVSNIRKKKTEKAVFKAVCFAYYNLQLLFKSIQTFDPRKENKFTSMLFKMFPFLYQLLT